MAESANVPPNEKHFLGRTRLRRLVSLPSHTPNPNVVRGLHPLASAAAQMVLPCVGKQIGGQEADALGTKLRSRNELLYPNAAHMFPVLTPRSQLYAGHFLRGVCETCKLRRACGEDPTINIQTLKRSPSWTPSSRRYIAHGKPTDAKILVFTGKVSTEAGPDQMHKLCHAFNNVL